MKNRAINPSSALAPIGLFSNGLLSKPGRLLAIAGQSGLRSLDDHPDFEEQARNCWENIRSIVQEAGGSMSDLVSINIYFRDSNPEHYRTLNRVRQQFLEEPYPASTAISGVQFVLPAMEIEIQALAVIAEPAASPPGDRASGT